MYKALTYVNLPVIGAKKSPGQEISREELEEAGQTDEDIEALIEGGSISDDMDAELHSDHVYPDKEFRSGELTFKEDDAGVSISDEDTTEGVDEHS